MHPLLEESLRERPVPDSPDNLTKTNLSADGPVSECHEPSLAGAASAARRWPRKSATIHPDAAIARVSVPSDQFSKLWGFATSAGSHTSNPKPTIIAVVNRTASSARNPVSRAIPARANAPVVAIAQNICPGGIHFGTRLAVAAR